MRLLFAVSVLLILAGCGADEGSWGSGGTLNDRQPVAAPESDARPMPRQDADCVAAAQQRAEDARTFGYDSETRKAIFDGAYADCAAWNRQHALRQPN